MVHAGGVHGGGVHGGGVMLTLATPHSRRCWQLFLRLSPYSRSSPFSGTALSQALSTPAGRAFPFRALRPAWAFPFRPKPIETPQKVRLSFAPRILRPAPGTEGFRAVDRDGHLAAGRRPARGLRAGRIARPTDKYPLEGGSRSCPGLTLQSKIMDLERVCAPMGRQACKHKGKTVQVLGRRRRYYQLWVLLYMGDGGGPTTL